MARVFSLFKYGANAPCKKVLFILQGHTYAKQEKVNLKITEIGQGVEMDR